MADKNEIRSSVWEKIRNSIVFTVISAVLVACAIITWLQGASLFVLVLMLVPAVGVAFFAMIWLSDAYELLHSNSGE